MDGSRVIEVDSIARLPSVYITGNDLESCQLAYKHAYGAMPEVVHHFKGRELKFGPWEIYAAGVPQGEKP